MNTNPALQIRPAEERDLDALVALENASFPSDRLSRRRLRHWIHAANRVFLIAQEADQEAAREAGHVPPLLGYCLILLHRGTRLARLYSIAIDGRARGRGIGKALLSRGEEAAVDQGRLYMRLEVAQDNEEAIRLYQGMGYTAFGTLRDYYEDHRDALRMQKRIRYIPENLLSRTTPWYRQTTDFSCGPASLMMAMASLEPDYRPSQQEELSIWREATTIFMTSGHGGCHPVGLALAARKRGFQATAYINQKGPLFMEGVRHADKKAILEVVDTQFHEEARRAGVRIVRQDISQAQIERHFNAGGAAVMLISTYRLDGKKAPHWVTITGMDLQCFYLHDPDPDDAAQIEVDCHHIPIARDDFALMSAFGRHKLRTAVLISK